jgi:hypothetical protein
MEKATKEVPVAVPDEQKIVDRCVCLPYTLD